MFVVRFLASFACDILCLPFGKLFDFMMRGGTLDVEPVPGESVQDWLVRCGMPPIDDDREAVKLDPKILAVCLLQARYPPAKD